MFRIKCRVLFFLLFVVGLNSSAQTAGKEKVLHKQVVRIIDLASRHDSVIHNLKDMSDDSSLYQMIVSGIRSDQFSPYASDDSHFTTKLSFEALKAKRWQRPDTMIVEDPVTGMKQMKVLDFSFEYYTINKYVVLEEWNFDKSTGKTNVQIAGIGPMVEKSNDSSASRKRPMYWLRYDDVRGIIARYEQYHPDNTIAGHIWNDYFLNDVKPQKVK